MTVSKFGPLASAPVTDSDVEFYKEHGYWVSPNMIPTQVLDAAERGDGALFTRETLTTSLLGTVGPTLTASPRPL